MRTGISCMVAMTSGCCLILATGTLCMADPAKPLRIVAFGDSTTFTRDNVRQVYAQRLAEELPRRGMFVTVINRGMPSNDTAGALARIERDVVREKPDLVIVQFGINDASVDVWKNPRPSRPRIELADFRANLEKIVRILRQSGASVILMTPNSMRWTKAIKEMYGKPPYKPDDADGFNVLLKDYAQAVRDIAEREKIPLVDVYAAFEDYGREPKQSVEELLVDGVHPGARGHEIVARLLVGQIAPHSDSHKTPHP